MEVHGAVNNATPSDWIEEGNSSVEVVETGSNGQVITTTEGTSRMIVNSAGNVLIGGTLPGTPNTTLNANGSATLAGTVQAPRFWSFDGSTNATFENTADRVNFAADNKPFFFRDTDNSGPVIQVGTFIGGTWTANATLNANGSAEFASSIESQGNAVGGAENGSVIVTLVVSCI